MRGTVSGVLCTILPFSRPYTDWADARVLTGIFLTGRNKVLEQRSKEYEGT